MTREQGYARRFAKNTKSRTETETAIETVKERESQIEPVYGEEENGNVSVNGIRIARGSSILNEIVNGSQSGSKNVSGIETCLDFWLVLSLRSETWMYAFPHLSHSIMA